MPEAIGWLAGHRLRWAFLVAFSAASLGSVAFQAPESPFRLLAAATALVLAVAYPIVWWRSAPPTEEGGAWRRVGRFTVLVLLSLVALGGGVVGVGVLLGWLLADSVTPLNVNWMNLGLLILGLVGGCLVGWWGFAFQRIVLRRRQRWWATVAVVVAVLGVSLAWLDARPIPNGLDRAGRELARQAGAGRYDILLVIDPGDTASRQLIRSARRDLAEGRGNSLFSPPKLNVPYDVAFGIAVPLHRSDREPLWRLVEPPTTDAVELVDSLARIDLSEGRPAYASYGRLVADTLVDARVRWRPGAQRGLAFVLRELPRLRDLDASFETAGDAIPVAGPPAVACKRFLRSGIRAQIADDPSTPVRWGSALARHCQTLEAYQDWEDQGRPPGAPQLPVAVHVLTGETRIGRNETWSTWMRALDGRFLRTPFTVDSSGTHVDAELLLRDARALHTGAPAATLARLTEIFRPHLFFDEEEKFFPVDVDWLLGDGEHEVCDRRGGGRDNCEPIISHLSLAGAIDEYIDFRGGARLGQDLVGRDAGPARMYVHTRLRNGRLYLGYWWFFRFNASPWRRDVNCLPGLTLSGLSCHDHEGDWEGVTVVLKLVRTQGLPDLYALRNLVPEAVIYDAHGHEVSWAWDDVELANDPDYYATHPVVYVAAGSHASYPAGCRRSECSQRLAGLRLGDGGFDGAQGWTYNRQNDCLAEQVAPDETILGPCLVALPSTRDGRLGVLWNAFPGAWGKAICTRIGKVCSQVDGPRSPSYQDRFEHPWTARSGPDPVLRSFRRGYGASVAGERLRWPPHPWPPRHAPYPNEPTLPHP